MGVPERGTLENLVCVLGAGGGGELRVLDGEGEKGGGGGG